MNNSFKYTLLLSLAVLSACSSISLKNYENSENLTKFDSTQAALNYLRNREKAVDKLNSFYKPKKHGSWFTRLFKSDEDILEEVVVFGLRMSAEVEVPALMRLEDASITNNQEAAVDEGGIVKRLGNNFIVLRKGKLFSINIGPQLTKTDEIEIQPETWAHDAWYDELLIYKDLLLVIGYSYENDSTEYVFFKLDNQGQFERQSTYLVNSGDYYSEDNYAGRLVGNKFVFYIEDLYSGYDPSDNSMDMSKFSPYTSKIDKFGNVIQSYPLFNEHTIYSPIISSRYLAMNTVIVCPIEPEDLSCTATSVLGGDVESHYASKEAFYFWVSGSGWNIEYELLPDSKLKRLARSKGFDQWPDNTLSAIIRVPINGEEVGAVKIKGLPIDQFSFKESNNHLLIAGRESKGEGGWFRPDYEEGSSFTAAIPLIDFQPTAITFPDSNYISIDSNEYGGTKNNRFIGNTLVYTSTYGHVNLSKIFVLDFEKGNSITLLESESMIDQLHPIGSDMLLVGYDQKDATLYQTLSLDTNIEIIDTLTVPNSELAESRSHGFFYKPYDDGGMYAIPVFIEPEENKIRENGNSYYAEDIADMLYTRVNSDLSMQAAGRLEGGKNLIWYSNDDCKISCYDWYGSARPIFWGDRIFALLKHELIEGVLIGDEVHELQRIDFREN